MPFVLIGSPNKQLTGVSYVDADSVSLAYNATSHLISLGHRRIAFINYLDNYTVTSDRHDGYVKALNKAGIPVDKKLVFKVNDCEKEAYECVTSMLKKGISFSAILTSTTKEMKGVYSALAEYGLKVGKDISTFDFGSERTIPLIPECSAVKMDFFKVGAAAMDILHELITGKSEAPIHRVIDADIIFTDSVQKVHS